MMTEEAASKPVPWKEGFFKMGQVKAMILQTCGFNQFKMKNLVALDYPNIESNISLINCSFGDFGEARQEIAEATGVVNYNIRIKSNLMEFKGVLNEEGTKITVWGVTNVLEEWVWLDEHAIEELKNDRDNFEAPSCPHITPKPDQKGKLFWLSGPPGAGKSTTCQLMARDKGFIYYEADSTMHLINPFIDTNVDNPTLASMASKPLKGVPQDTAEILLNAHGQFRKLMETNAYDKFAEAAKPFYKVMAEDIVRQQKRLGGAFAVAHAVARRESRDYLRSLVGPDLVFIVLNMTLECMKERLTARHGGAMDVEGMANRWLPIYEPGGSNEENTFNVTIEKGMSKEEVLKKILDVIKRLDVSN